MEYKNNIIEQIGNTPLIKLKGIKGGFTPKAYLSRRLMSLWLKLQTEKPQIFANLRNCMVSKGDLERI